MTFEQRYRSGPLNCSPKKMSQIENKIYLYPSKQSIYDTYIFLIKIIDITNNVQLWIPSTAKSHIHTSCHNKLSHMSFIQLVQCSTEHYL